MSVCCERKSSSWVRKFGSAVGSTLERIGMTACGTGHYREDQISHGSYILVDPLPGATLFDLSGLQIALQDCSGCLWTC